MRWVVDADRLSPIVYVALAPCLMRMLIASMRLARTRGMQPDTYANEWFPTWFALLLPFQQLLPLWDAMVVRPPQFALFVAVCLLHSFRKAARASNHLGLESSIGRDCFLGRWGRQAHPSLA